MMLQPIVENAIVHGIVPKQDTGKIEIELAVQDRMLCICITDNGIGREAAAAKKKNMPNTNPMLYKLCGTGLIFLIITINKN